MLICVKYARDWKLGLKKDLQRLGSKTSNIHDTNKMKISVKNLFNRYE